MLLIASPLNIFIIINIQKLGMVANETTLHQRPNHVKVIKHKQNQSLIYVQNQNDDIQQQMTATLLNT